MKSMKGAKGTKGMKGTKGTRARAHWAILAALLAAALILPGCGQGGGEGSPAAGATQAQGAGGDAGAADSGASVAAGAGDAAGSAEGGSGDADGGTEAAGGAGDGAAAGGAAGERITLTFFDKNSGEAFSDPVALEVAERTGINLEIQQPTGNPEEKLSLLLASGELPDIVLMDRRSDIVNQYIAAGGLIALNDLIDEHGPDIKAMYGDVLKKSLYEDGKNYFLNNWYGVDPDPGRGINIRMDLLKEMGYGAQAERGDPFTQRQFVEMLAAFKAQYSGDGSAIPFTVNGEYMETVFSTFKGMYGMKRYYEQDGGQLQLDVRDPRYLEMARFVNQLYRDGLMDKEWPVNKDDIFNQKLISGQVMAYGGGYASDANSVFRDDGGQDTDRQFYMFRVVADGTDPNATTFSPRSSLGWDAIGITASNRHPVETIEFMNSLASEEGQYLLLWGVEGLHWDIVDGKHQPRPEILPGFRNDWGAFSKETGIRKWTWFVKNGFGSDGTPFDLVTKYDVDAITVHARVSMEGSGWDTAVYDDLGPLGGTPDALVEQKLNDIIDQGFSKMAFAASDADVQAEYAKMLAELDANGAASVEAIYTRNYQNRLALQGG
ncbi:MAG: extracellular solute-binding protein [Clostridiales bacterium]|jgi:putative aldouronate transport system substrate-binding protein|nr:extracellular solute-binding protein [Clostridiales bacterium]